MFAKHYFYHPDLGGDEFVELLNITGNPVALYDTLHPTNAWRLSGVDYTFPTNIVLEANGTLLLVATNAASFRAKYSVPTNVLIFGPFVGQLQDSGENLELLYPDNPNTNGFVPYVVLDAVRYNDKAPWPPGADGSGQSLQRLAAFSFGNEPLNWTAAAPTPGGNEGSGDTDKDGMPDAWEQEYGTLVYVKDADDDLDHDGLTNLEEYQAGTHPNDAASVLELRVMREAGSVVLDFLASSNRTYSVLYKPSLGAEGWLKLTDIPALPLTRKEAITNALPAGNSSQFYRLVTPTQP